MLVKHISSPAANGLDVRSVIRIDTPRDFVEPEVENRVHIVDIRFKDGMLDLSYHKMLQAQCNLTDEIMLKHLEWVHAYLKSSGFLIQNVKGEEYVAGIFIDPVSEFEYNFVATVNLEVLSETEGMDISSYFINYFKMRRDEKLKNEGEARLHALKR